MAIDDRKNDFEFIRWSAQIKKRDNFTCQICGRRNIYLESHHKWSYADYPEERTNLDCGICLCSDCHKAFHDRYGYGQNTPIQFDEFQKICEIFFEISENKIKLEENVKNIIKYFDGYIKM